MESVHVLFDDAATPAMHNLCMSDNKQRALMDEIAIECGKRVAKCRKALDMTQEQLSKATGYKVRKGGLSPSQIGNFEQGTRRIGIDEAEILASIFTDYPSAYFLGVVDEREARILLVMRMGNGSLPKTG